MTDIYPMTIVKDRYLGTYSGGQFTAWNELYHDLPTEIESGDVTCIYFWKKFKQGKAKNVFGEPLFCGKEESPEEAMDDLITRVSQKSKTEEE